MQPLCQFCLFPLAPTRKCQIGNFSAYFSVNRLMLNGIATILQIIRYHFGDGNMGRLLSS